MTQPRATALHDQVLAALEVGPLTTPEIKERVSGGQRVYVALMALHRAGALGRCHVPRSAVLWWRWGNE